MQYSVKTFLLLLAFGAFTLGACKDDEKSRSELLTAVSCWQLSKSEIYNDATSAWENEPIDDCDKDDCTTFKSGNVASLDEGATKCDPSDPQTETGTWALTDDDKTLTFVVGIFGLSGTIVELSESKLVVEADFFGVKTRSTLTAK